jgi:hypothetical protein
VTVAVGGVAAGGLGFLVVLVLIVASILLFRSMNARLRRVHTRFPKAEEPPNPRRAEDDGPV